MTIDWTEAACRAYHPDTFFEPEYESLALAVCRICPIQIECLNDALVRRESFGVWGGTTERQRRPTFYRKIRVKCPSCQGRLILHHSGKHQICRGCGVSWPA